MNITDQEFTNFADALDGIYKGMGREPRQTFVDPLGVARWTTDYITLRLSGSSHEDSLREVKRRIEAIVAPPSPPPPPSGGEGGIKGRLRVEGLTFRDDNGPVLPLLCHFGEAFSAFTRRPDDVIRQLKVIKDAGYDGIRFWDVLGYYPVWKGREVSPIFFKAKDGRVVAPTENYYAQLAGFLEVLHQLGLKAHHTRGDLNSWPFEEIKRHCLAVGDLQRRIGGDVIALNESLNEAWQNGVAEAPLLREMGDLLGGHALRALSSGADDFGGETLEEARRLVRDVAVVHGFRGGESCDRLRHIITFGYEVLPLLKVPGWQGEPTGPGPGVTVGREDHPEALASLALGAWMARQAWVYMSSHGVFWNGPIESQPGFYEVARARTFLPKDIMAFPLLTHGGERWKGQRVFVADREGHLRCDHAFKEREFVCLIYGEDPLGKGWKVPVERSFEGTIINPATGEAHPFSARQGEEKAIHFEKARLVVGSLVD